MSKKLSVVIITFNEEKNIGRCIDSVQDIADEILIVDSFSTDETKNICLTKGARFEEHAFEGHIEQKNYALSLTANPICLSLDADEALSETLKNSIKDALQNWEYDGFYINRLTNYCGKWIKHSGWYPDANIRLFDKTKGSWTGKNPHDKYVIQTQHTAHLKGDILHYSFYTIAQHIQQINYFTDISSKAEFEKGKKSNLFLIWFKPKFKFLRDFIFKLGVLDGYYGYVIAKNSAHAKFLKYIKLRNLYKNDSSTS